MLTVNAFVIYFTFGVPFGVLSIYLTSSRLIPIRAAWVTAHLALWPAFAVNALANSLLRRSNPIKFSNALPIRNDFRSRFDSVIPETIDAGSRRNLLFEVERFVAISEASTEAHEIAASSETPIFAIVKHPFPIVAAKCRKRKLLAQLSRHQNDAYQTIYKLADEQGINLPSAISAELNAMAERHADAFSSANNTDDRLAA